MKKLRHWYKKQIAQDPQYTQRGWTFVETLIVIGIILILTSSVGIMAFRYLDRAKVAAAKNQIETFSLALTSYFMDNKQFPTAEQGLDALWSKPTAAPVNENWDGPYLNKAIPKDPWDREYEYTIPGPEGLPYGIRSYGADGAEGGSGNDKDITSWEN